LEKPKIFTHTIYSEPTEDQLLDVNSFELSPSDLIRGLTYTIVGKGKNGFETKKKILNTLSKLSTMFPNNINYKIAFNHFKDIENHYNIIKGGKGDKSSILSISNKFNVPRYKIEEEFLKGLKVELEHSNNYRIAVDIVFDHLVEIPDYYTRLIKMEDKANIDLNENFKSFIRKSLNEKIIKKAKT